MHFLLLNKTSFKVTSMFFNKTQTPPFPPPLLSTCSITVIGLETKTKPYDICPIIAKSNTVSLRTGRKITIPQTV